MPDHHRITLVGGDDAWQAKCACRWRSPIGTRLDAADAQLAHIREVSRAQAGLRPRNYSLVSELAWFEHQADNYANTADERALWRRLADELAHRLGGAADDQPTLW